MPTVTCAVCGATGDSYFGGHEDPKAPHPWSPEMGTEGFCFLCGAGPNSPLHDQHRQLEGKGPLQKGVDFEVAVPYTTVYLPQTDAENHYQKLIRAIDVLAEVTLMHGFDPKDALISIRDMIRKGTLMAR
jgi:hypothetical protein